MRMHRLGERVVGAVVEGADRARARLAKSPRVRKLAYRVRNRRQFTSLWAHDIMLGDRVRLDAYEAALRKHLGPDDVALDVGTGTGVLALMAARHARRVHAIDHGPIIDAARAVARDNGVANVEFHKVHSAEFAPPEPVDAIVHEQIGSALLNERMVDTISGLRDRVLKPGGAILPGRFDLYVEPVELRDDVRYPPAWQQTVHGIRFDALRAYGDRQPFDYWYKLWGEFPLGHFLCRPEPVLTVDLATANPGDLPHRIAYERPVVAPGSMDGFCVYFTAWFDEEISITTSPDAPLTHWNTPMLRVESHPVAEGDVIRLDLHAGDLADPDTWRWR
jgi:protein arginine N-methyltransferase 1